MRERSIRATESYLRKGASGVTLDEWFTTEENVLRLTEVSRHPLVTVMIRPRQTMEAILAAERDRLAIPLILLATFSHTLVEERYEGLGDVAELLPGLGALIIVLAATLAVMFTVALFYAFSYLLTWTGRLLGGKADSGAVRAALAWGSVPYVWALVYRLPARILYGEKLILPVFGRESPGGAESLDWASLPAGMLAVLIACVLLEVVFAIWFVIVINKCLGEAQGFSAWRALGNMLSAVFGPLVLVGAVAALGIAIFGD